ncbi:MAG: glycosyltransferase family 4 protein [Acidimicrobiales bacterium]|nr:glycosyltransferase family 4 protein [Acidimicrobiales bacterium]
MRLTFAYPTSPGESTGGVVALFEFANALSRRGHDVRFLHGPEWPTRIGSLDELPEKCQGHGVQHFLVDAIDDPAVPDGDIVFLSDAPVRYGLPAVIVQGYGMLSPELEDAVFRVPAPKVCVARWLIDTGIGLGAPAEQFVHAPCGIDHDIFQVRTPLEDRPIDVAALFHPHREKGWPDLLAALHRIVEMRPGTRGVVFARNKPPQELPMGIEFVHSPDHQQLATEVYGRTRVFVQASLREGFGLTPVEAMACGATLVTTDNGGSHDYGIDGVTARVTPPGDPEALATATVGLLNDDAERQRLGRAGVDHVQQFRWDRSAEKLEQFLERYRSDPAAFQHPAQY